MTTPELVFIGGCLGLGLTAAYVLHLAMGIAGGDAPPPSAPRGASRAGRVTVPDDGPRFEAVQAGPARWEIRDASVGRAVASAEHPGWAGLIASLLNGEDEWRAADDMMGWPVVEATGPSPADAEILGALAEFRDALRDGRAGITAMSDRDRDRFLALRDDAGAGPNAALVRAAERYADRGPEDDVRG